MFTDYLQYICISHWINPTFSYSALPIISEGIPV